MSASLFIKFVEGQGLDIELVESEKGTRTAEEAAEVHGVPVSNIVKSLVLKAANDFVIALCPGDKRIDFKEVKANLNKENVRMATPTEVKEMTGHSIGGVPPFGHQEPLRTFIVSGFDSTKPLWAAAGAADLNFKTNLSELKEIVEQVNSMLG